MALTKLTADVENISALDDRPNDVDGLTATQLKALFDKAGKDIKTYINGTLTTQVDALVAKATVKTVQLTLPAGQTNKGFNNSSWGITSSSTVFCQPTDACLADWCGCGVKCSAVSTNGITITATTAPANDVVINVLMWG